EEQATAGLNDPFWFDFGADVYAYHQRVLLEDADGEALDVFNGVEFGLSPRDEGTAITRVAYRIQLAGPDEDRPDVDGPVLVHRRVGVHIPYGQDAVRAFRFKRVDVSAYRVEGEKLYAWVTVCADAPLRGYGRGIGSSEVRIRDPHTDPAGTDVVAHERPDLAVWESAVSGVAAHLRLA